jgi:hypothetical protein
MLIMEKREKLDKIDKEKLKPNLFIVGAAKCGTTSLANILANHNQVFMSEVKEPHYFPSKYRKIPLNGPGDRKEFIHNLNEYLDLYKNSSRQKYLLDATVDHLYFKECAKDIYNFNENSKIIIMLRDPSERAFSSYKHLLRENREKFNFVGSLELEEKRIKSNWGILWRYTEAGFYYNSVKEYINVFGNTNVKVIFSDDFSNNQEKVLTDLYNWLDIAPDKSLDHDKFNKGGKPSFKLKVLLRLKKIKILKWAGKKIIPNRKYQEFVRNNTSDISMDYRTTCYLKQLFYEDIVKLEKLLNKDLSKWYSSIDEK